MLALIFQYCRCTQSNRIVLLHCSTESSLCPVCKKRKGNLLGSPLYMLREGHCRQQVFPFLVATFVIAMSEFIMSFVNPLIEKLIDPLLKHLSYIICVGRRVKSLEDKVNTLKAKKEDVKDEIEIAERAGKEATHEVRGWMETVEKLEEDANSISNKYRNRNCMFHGTCSLNCFLNYRIGGDAVEVEEKVEAELRRRDGFIEITKEAPPPVAQPVPVTTLPEVSRSQIESMLGEALNFLKNDGESILGIWGMGGVGKTTLLKQINNALAEDASFGFDRVVWVTASREWTIENIQKHISEALKLHEEGNHHDNIYNYLINKSFVILLDDLWRRMDLEELGIPPLGTNGTCKRKLILTTRIKQVCQNMGARLSRTIKVDCLIPEVARLLFRAKVGEETINSHPQIPDIADKVADECDGLPMALVCIARAMAGQQRVNLWEKAIEDLKKSKVSTIQGIDDPLPLLKFSYDYLNDPSIQECLLLCALWPEDYKIPKDIVIECWMGQDLLGEFDTIDEANNKGGEIIDVLEKASLLEWCETDFIDFDLVEGSVKLHDLIRDMALWIARDCGKNEKKWVVLDKAPQDEKSWREAQKMSLMRGKITTLPSNNIGSGSSLITLILPYNDLSHSELGILQNLRLLKYLDLSYNWGMKKFPIEICQLFKLEYLNLSFNKIDSLPDELQGLKNLKYLLLRCTNITEISRQLLSSLVSLEVLDLFNNWYHPISYSPIIDNLDCMQGRLKSLVINSCTESDLSKLAQLSSTIHIQHLCIRVGFAKDWMTSLHLFPRYDLSKVDGLTINGQHTNLVEELVMEENHLLFLKSLSIYNFFRLKEIIWQRVEQRDTVSSAIHTVHINSCRELKHVSCLVYLPVLESLVLVNCDELKHVVCWEEEATSSIEMEGKNKHIFPALKVLFLVRLNSLETICNHTMAFPSLEILKVRNCRMLRKLPFDSPTSCSKLKKIECRTPEWWDSLDIGDDLRASLKPSFRLMY